MAAPLRWPNSKPGGGPFSSDGRYVLFVGNPPNLDADSTQICRGGPEPDCNNLYLRDRVAGLTTRVSETVSGGEMNTETTYGSISADGLNAAFYTAADNLLGPGGDTVLCDMDNDTFDDDPCGDVFVRSPDWSESAALDRSGDTRFDDTILEVIDTSPVTPQRIALCPAGEVAVSGGMAAFLRPEHGGATTLAKLPLCQLGTISGFDVDLKPMGSSETRSCSCGPAAATSSTSGSRRLRWRSRQPTSQ